MDEMMSKISFSFVFWFLVVGILIYLVLYVFEHYMLPLLKYKKQESSLWWKKFKLVVWTVFFLLFFYGSFQENMIITLASVAIILGIGWNFWRNLFSGILILFSEEFKAGDYISTDFAAGELTNITLVQSELINDKGELVIIPNHQLRNAVLKHITKQSNVKTYTFEVVTTDSSETISDVRKKALHCPYITANQPLVVDSLSKDKFQVKAALIDGIYLDQVREWFG